MKIVKKIVFTIVTILLVLLLTYNIYNFISLKILKRDIATVNGYAILEVVSGSMEPVIHVGDMIIIDTDDTEYGLDDIVTFYDSEGSFTTHRIIDIEDGLYTTKGDNNNTKDKLPIAADKIVGKYVGKIPLAGRVLASFKSPITMILILVIGVLICILLSTDKDGNPILDEKEKEYQEFLAYQNAKNKEVLEIPTKSSKNTPNKTTKEKQNSKVAKNKKTTVKVKDEETKKKTPQKAATKTSVKKVDSTTKKMTEKKTNSKAKVTVKTVDDKVTTNKKTSSNKTVSTKKPTKKSVNTKPKIAVKTVKENPKAKTSTKKVEGTEKNTSTKSKSKTTSSKKK